MKRSLRLSLSLIICTLIIRKLTEIKDLKTKIIKLELNLTQENDKSNRQAIYVKSKDKEITKLKQEIDRLNSSIANSNTDSIQLRISMKDQFIQAIEDKLPTQPMDDKAKLKTVIEQRSEYITTRLLSEINRLIILLETTLSETPSNEFTRILLNHIQSIDSLKKQLSSQEYLPLLETLLKTICDILISNTDSVTPKPKSSTKLEIQVDSKELQGSYTQRERNYTEAIQSSAYRNASKSARSLVIKPRCKTFQSEASTPNRYGTRAVYNQFTKRVSDFFDPYIQYGGKSIINSKSKIADARSRQRYRFDFMGESHNRIENPKCTKITNLFKEKNGWKNINDFFNNNGGDNKVYRMPSPDKITSNLC